MSTHSSSSPVARFGDFELDLRTGELRRNGTFLKLQPQPAKILAFLVSRPGEIVTRQDLVQEVWGSRTFVDFEQGLNFAIRQIRTVLEDDAEHPRFVETLPRRGYRFAAPVSCSGPDGPDPGSGREESKRKGLGRVGMWLVVALVMVIAVAMFLGRKNLRRLSPWSKNAQIESVAVLPLRNLSQDPEQEYFSDGMTDELITELAKIPGLRVTSHTSVERYKETTRALPDIARELGVDAVVEGTVTRAGKRVRITAQLIEGRSDRHLWADSYERDLEDVLTLQSDVSRDISGQIRSRAMVQDGDSPRRTILPEAHEAYLKGLYFWNKRTEASVRKGIEYFEEAAKLDPSYAIAYAGLADSYIVLTGHRYMRPKEAYPKVQEAARKALELDEKLAEAHTALGSYHWEYEWDKTAAEKEFRRAIELNPSQATAHQWYAEELAVVGRGAEAVAEVTRARELDPLSLPVTVVAGWIHYLGRDYDGAIEQYRRALELDSRFPIAHLYLGRAYAQTGNPEGAVAEVQLASELSGKHPFFQCWLGYAYAKAGNRSEALRIVHELESAAQTRYVSSHDVAAIYAALKENTKALMWLNRAYEERSYTVLQLPVEPEFDSLRADARFEELVGRVSRR